ncbi:hypothetical protein WMF20_21525 [Sorangium sp. So ce834]|uniref:hypothetical protein n=1 Tax=Sorangium sp. So ce834 TaxID=3133321 RepID=UPI003F63461B
MKVREIVTSAQILRLEDDGIIRATAFPVHMSLAFAQEVVRATIELGGGTPGGGPICPGVIHMKAGRQEDH